MFKRFTWAMLLCTTMLTPTQVTAGPVVTAALVGVQGWFAATFGAQVGAFLYNLAGSVLFNAAASLLTRGSTRNSSNLKRELATPSSRPAYRYVYGHVRMPGTPLPARTKGNILYLALLLNSRPSDGSNLSIYFDKRLATIESGNIYDFAGNGALLSIDGFTPIASPSSLRNPRAWMQLGSETAPPEVFTDEAPDIFSASDGWQGRTVLWLRLDAGESAYRSERWPRVPPEIEVEMDYSLVYDMRETGHDPDDDTTWTFSANQALCTLDALRTNPIKRYPLAMLDLDTWEQSADVADESVGRLSGGPEPRYETNGFVVFNGGEILDQLTPMAAAGGGSFIRVGGRLGYAPGVYTEVVYTATDIVEEGGIDLQTLVPGRDLPSAVRASYIAPDRDWQNAELPQIAVAGASVGNSDVLELPQSFVTSPTQAMRLQQIKARELAAQRTLSCMLWPDAMNVIAGSTVEFDMPAGFTRINGRWRVMSANPGLWVSDENSGGIAMRIPVTLQQTAESIYGWNAATDQLDIETVSFDPILPVTVDPDLAEPTGLAVEAYWEGTLRVSAVQAESTFVDGLEFLEGATATYADADFLASGFPGPGLSFLYDSNTLTSGDTRYYWARSIRFPNARSSGTGPVSATVAAPLAGVTATALLGGAQFSGTAPAFTSLTGFKVYRSAVGAGFGAATAISGILAASPGAAYSVVAGDATRTNLFTNADFAAGATGWTVEPEWSIGSGVATKIAGAVPRRIHQSPAQTAGNVLRVAATLSGTGGVGSFRFRSTGATNGESLGFITNARFVGSLTVPASPTNLGIVGTSGATGSVDDIVAYVQTGACLAQGVYDFFLVPVNADGLEGTPSSAFTLTIV